MDFSTIMNLGPQIGVAFAIIQALKIMDTKDAIKKWWPLISILVGGAIGIIWGIAASHKIPALVQDAVQNAAYTALAYLLKKAALDPIGIRLPGDSDPRTQPTTTQPQNDPQGPTA